VLVGENAPVAMRACHACRASRCHSTATGGGSETQ
jgi:hypothetical protein